MNAWQVIEIMPTTEGVYICLEIYSPDMVDMFNEGKYIPSADEISGALFNGKEFVEVMNGTEYPIHTITHWLQCSSGTPQPMLAVKRHLERVDERECSLDAWNAICDALGELE